MWNKAGFVGRGQSFCTNPPPSVWFSSAVFLVSSFPADLLHLKGCAGEQTCSCFEACWGRGCSKEEREIGGGAGWGRVWIGGREQVIKQLLDAGAEAGVLPRWAVVLDRTCPMPMVGYLPFGRVLECVCVFAEPRNSRSCTGSFQPWYSLLSCDLQYLFYYLRNQMVFLSSGNITQVSTELVYLPSSPQAQVLWHSFCATEISVLFLWLGPLLRS